MNREPDAWPELEKPKALGPKKKALTVVKHIRRALAHGNIFTRGEPNIEQIVLLSQVNKDTNNKFSFLAVAPGDFRSFLQNWLKFLGELQLPQEVVPDFEETAPIAARI